MTLALGRTGFHLSAIASTWDSESESYERGEVRAQVVMTGEDANAHFEILEASRDQIEKELGEPLVWHASADARQRKVYLRRSADIRDHASWPELDAWLKTKLETLHRVFAPRVKQLDASQARG
jgi:hypothetical protein